MRVLRTSWAAVVALGLAPAALGQATPQKLLTQYAPVLKGVDHDLPAAAVLGDDPAVKAAVAACKIETTPTSWTLRDGQGKILRRFVDTDPKKLTQRKRDEKPITHLDQWSYYQDGFEVYREVDLDEDGSLDEVRWMNSGGTRIAKVRPIGEGGGSQVVAWVRLSPEEASKVLVQAIVSGDRAMLETVLATPEELKAIGAPESTLARVAEAKAGRGEALTALLASLKESGWSGRTAWSRFDGAMPHVIPSDAPGLSGEVLLYENVVVFADAGNPAANAKLAYLSAPDVVKVGEAWKFTDLPHAVDPVNPKAGSLVSLRGDIYKGGGATPAESDPALAEALKLLAEYDANQPGADKAERAEWHVGRLKLVSKVINIQKDPAAKLEYQKQAVNDLAEAVRTGQYPAGLEVLDRYVKGGGKIGSYADHRRILVQFDLEADEPGAPLLKVQTDFLAKFEKFLEEHPDADEVPEVLLQLASVTDFNGEEEAAKKWYARLAKDHPATEPGKKAAGAIRRLDSDGQPLKLAGAGLSGKTVSVDDYRGKPLLVVYWTSLAPGDQDELRDLAALREKLGPKGFEILGVNLDDDKAAVEAHLKANPAPWSTIHEPGGMDGRLANEMGIISTPTMFLLDAKGQVVNRKIRKAAEVEKALEKTLAGRGVGLNVK